MLWRKLHLNWRYALGEFAIVVLGVLAALWVENWNSYRNDRVLEREYLNSLLGDFDSDSRSLDNTIRRSEEIAEAQLIVLGAADRQSFNISPTQFVDAVHETGLLVFATHSRRTMNDLMSTGNLRIIESESVRTDLANFYSGIENRAQWQQNWREYQIHIGKMLPEIVRWQGRISLSLDPNQASAPPWIQPIAEITEQEAKDVLDRLISHPDALPAIENMLRIQSVNYQYNYEVKQQLLHLKDTVQTYLDELEKS
jgi:hypothetical protein